MCVYIYIIETVRQNYHVQHYLAVVVLYSERNCFKNKEQEKCDYCAPAFQ